VLVADRLSAMMLALNSVLGLAVLLFSLARWDRAGPRFHALFMLLLMGVNGAFLTGDLFNLFVFFEVLLAASYGLLLHGSGNARVRAGLHYIAFNLAASSLFLLGVSLVYGVTGSLNMADIAARVATVAPESRSLLEAGLALLGIAFVAKAAMWPVGFWLPTAYSVASAPAAALFAIMSKVGVYVLLRLSALLGANGLAGFGHEWLFYGGLATIAFGTVGMLASQELPRMVAFAVLVSSGTLLAMLSYDSPAVTAGAIYYLVVSTLTISTLFLLSELMERGRSPEADIVAVTLEAFGDEDELEHEQEVGIAIPGTMAILSVSFACCTLLLAGMPPLSGFLAKFMMMVAVVQGDGGQAGGTSPASWVVVGLLIVSGLATMIALLRAGINRFWVPTGAAPPRVRVIEIGPVALFLGLCVALTVLAAPAMSYLDAMAAGLHAPHNYVDAVLGSPGGKGAAP
jgi:multicomponent K+:H+ antiporter subunit D